MRKNAIREVDGVKKFCLLILLWCLIRTGVSSQTIYGTVVDEQNVPLARVNIRIPALQMYGSTLTDGSFAFRDLSRGMFTLQFELIGYVKETQTVNLATADSIELHIVLRASPLQLPAVTVTAKPQPDEILNTAQAVSILEGRELDERRGQSVMESIQDLPGVSLYSSGPLSLKPVIRGLMGQRVVILENGMRHESQQWDDDQNPEIDDLSPERIEVVRGPGSVLFGSDALGGIVNIIDNEVDTSQTGAGGLGGKVRLGEFTNNHHESAGILLDGRAQDIDYGARLDVHHAGNISTPAGPINNSGADELNGGGQVGLRKDWGNLALNYAHYDQVLEIPPTPDDNPDATPVQDTRHDKLLLSYLGSITPFRVELHGEWQRNQSREYESLAEKDSASVVPDVHLNLTTLTLDAKVHHPPVGGIFGTIGASVMDQSNETLGREALIPSFDQMNVASFVYEEMRLTGVSLSAGVRFDRRSLNVYENEELRVGNQTKNYDALTGSFGIVWHASGPMTYAVSVGRGWRSPIAQELFVNGLEEGGIRFKIGNPNLVPEESFDVDLTGHYSTPNLNVEVSFFNNRINRYIYLSPTGEIDSASGAPKYAYRQANATLQGVEMNVEAGLASFLVMNGGMDLVLGRNEETSNWLPLIPAHRVEAGMKFTQPSVGFLQSPSLRIDVKFVLAQNKVDVFETPTAGYTLFDAGIGGDVSAFSRRVTVSCVAENLFDRAYRDHLSRYKDYALDPGRDIALRLSMPFAIVP